MNARTLDPQDTAQCVMKLEGMASARFMYKVKKVQVRKKRKNYPGIDNIPL
jgi:hypothetical protein